MPRKKKQPLLVQIKDAPALARDVESKALLATDRAAYLSHLNRKKRDRQKDEQIKTLEERLQKLESIVEKLSK